MDKREQIIEIATELFAENGYEKTPISAICARASISKGLVFHHFKTKDELLREIFISITEIISESGNSYKNVIDPRERLVAFIDSIFVAMAVPEHRLIYQLNFNLMVQPATRAILTDLIEARAILLREEVEDVFNYISLENSKVAGRMFIAEIDGIALNYLFFGEDFDLDLIKEEFINKYT